MATNPYRKMVVEFAQKKGICTQCFSRPAEKDMLQCPRCIEACQRKRLKNKAQYREYLNKNYPKQKARRKREKIGISTLHKSVSQYDKI